MIELRAEVRAFAEAMELKLRQNDHKGGWGKEGIWWLKGRIDEEVRELEEAIHILNFKGRSYRATITEDEAMKAVASEAVDVANFAMMIADCTGALK